MIDNPIPNRGVPMGTHETTKSHRIELNTGDYVYIRVPEFNEQASIKRTIPLRDLVKDYKGADVELDFSEDGTLLSIEILPL